MFEKPISKDADKLLCLLYREYLKARAAGKPRPYAKAFGNYDSVSAKIIPEWNILDVDETLRELWKNDFITASGYDNHVYSACLTDEAVVYMENRFRKGLSEVLDAISKLKP